jgi:mono/diheme cytochrome c family protein
MLVAAALALLLSTPPAPATPVPGSPTSTPPPSTTSVTAPSATSAGTGGGLVPSIALPAGFGKNARPASFGVTLTVVVPGVPVPPPRPAAPPSTLEQGRRLYQQRCTLCHGDAGAADGVGARRVTPEPQHLDAVIWQDNVSDEEITKAILEGGAAVSRSPMMPANRDLKNKPEVVKSLVAYVRSLRAPFGSVMGSLTLADTSSRARYAAARKDGTATLVFPDVPRGKTRLMVLVDGDGKIGCTLELDVQQDTTVTCR